MKYKNILITGSRGFIGTHLKNKLKQDVTIQIFEHTRESSFDNLEQYIENIDFIYHLAGEVNPKSDHATFFEGNVETTQKLLNLLEKMELKIPILLASSVHAKNPKNDYGWTKQKSEELILDYSHRHDIPVYIYQLPHLFGNNCKPNYNSVISTWIYNTIHNLNIVIFDRAITMHYSYINDIIKEFIQCLKENNLSKNAYKEPSVIYKTSLGEIVDFLEEFKSNVENIHYKISQNEFKAKLFATYQDYFHKTLLKD